MIDVWRIINAIITIKFRSPHLRVGQIISNAAWSLDPFMVPDADLADALEEYVRNI